MSSVAISGMDTLVWQAFASVIVPGTGNLIERIILKIEKE